MNRGKSTGLLASYLFYSFMYHQTVLEGNTYPQPRHLVCLCLGNSDTYWLTLLFPSYR